jgi:hypothetical protein
VRSGRWCCGGDGVVTQFLHPLLSLRILPIQDDGVVSQLDLSADEIWFPVRGTVIDWTQGLTSRPIEAWYTIVSQSKKRTLCTN